MDYLLQHEIIPQTEVETIEVLFYTLLTYVNIMKYCIAI